MLETENIRTAHVVICNLVCTNTEKQRQSVTKIYKYIISRSSIHEQNERLYNNLKKERERERKKQQTTNNTNITQQSRKRLHVRSVIHIQIYVTSICTTTQPS